MKKFLLFSVIALLVGCVDYTDDINAIDERLDALEQSVPSIEEQISAIQTSIKALEEVDESLDESIKALEANDEATAEEIAALKDADKAIEAKIAELKKYVDDALKATKDWVSATFATLEQLNALSGEVAALKSLVDANKAEAAANLANAISNLETSLKKWVGEQLSNYYTIAEIDAKILALQTAITNGDSALQEELNKLKAQLETAKAELTEAYKKAIKEAIETNNGVINAKIAEEIGKVNGLIEELNSKLAKLQIQVDKNTEDIAKLLARIQSVSYVPQYSDGKATLKYIGGVSQVVLDFKVSPKECVAELAKIWESAIKIDAVYTETRAVSFIDMPIIKFEADAENGVISVIASGENLSEGLFAGTQSASASLTISDGNSSVASEYVQMVAQEVDMYQLSVPANQIWYTSTDGKIVTPYKSDVFGGQILSNTYENGMGIIVFDAPVISIGAAAFSTCSSLASMIIPDRVIAIGNSAFNNCSGLTSVIIPNSITSIGNYAFHTCTSLTSVTIPDSVTSIGDIAFYRCNSLTSVTIPKSVTKIDNGIFSSCDKLEYFYGKFASKDNRCLIVGNTLNTYAAGSTLSSYTIPEYITVIGPNAFQHNDYITSITITEGVTEIGVLAFAHCGNLASVFCKPTTPPSIKVNPYTSGVFYGNASDRKIYVPRESVDAYKVADGWSDYADSIVGYDF